jgi:hypothetical protein
MAVELWIDDGNPWYLSPDIWVVPSDDPTDPPAMPYANVSAYVWARVHNRGTTAVSNATVRYWWADPSTAISESTAHLIGTSNVALAAGETKEVLCLIPWLPQYVNDGHECLIAEAFASADPLPARAPTDPFNVPGTRQIAQRNITVGAAASAMMFMHAFIAGNIGGRETKRISIVARRAPIELLEPLRAQIGLARLPAEAEGFDRFSVQPFRCGDQPEKKGKPKIDIDLPAGHQQGVALFVPTPRGFKAGTGALFLIEQHTGGEITGGVAVLILPEQKQPQSPAR